MPIKFNKTWLIVHQESKAFVKFFWKGSAVEEFAMGKWLFPYSSSKYTTYICVCACACCNIQVCGCKKNKTDKKI